jgi:hypothetical protein
MRKKYLIYSDYSINVLFNTSKMKTMQHKEVISFLDTIIQQYGYAKEVAYMAFKKTA